MRVVSSNMFITDKRVKFLMLSQRQLTYLSKIVKTSSIAVIECILYTFDLISLQWQQTLFFG